MLRILFICLLAIVLPVFSNAQSGWTRKKNGFFGKLDFSHLSAEKYYNPLGDEVKTTVFQQSTLNFYGEYGLTDRLTAIVHAPILRRNAYETTEAVFGPGDLKLELKYRLFQKKDYPVTISIAPEIPTGRKNAFAQNKNNPAERINLPTGDGEFNVWTTLAASKSFGKKYISGFGAYNFRTKYDGLAFRDLYQFGIEGGWSPVKKLWVNAKLRAQFSNGKSQHPALSFVRGDATTYTLASAEAFYKFSKNWGAAATFLTGGNWVAPFKNIYIAPYFSIGVVYEK